MENRYYKNVDGKLTEIPTMEDCVKAITERYNDAVKRIKYLEEENKKLKDESYKDNELQKMQKDLTKAREDLYRGFSITEDEHNKIQEWMKKHDEEKHGLNTLDKRVKAGGVCGGRYVYEFVPTSIGTIGIVKCSCGDSFTFCELN